MDVINPNNTPLKCKTSLTDPRQPKRILNCSFMVNTMLLLQCKSNIHSKAFCSNDFSRWLGRKPNRITTLIFLCSVVVVDGLAVPFAFAKFARQVFLLLLVVMPQQLLPIIWIHVLLLFDDLPLDLLDLERKYVMVTFKPCFH